MQLDRREQPLVVGVASAKRRARMAWWFSPRLAGASCARGTCSESCTSARKRRSLPARAGLAPARRSSRADRPRGLPPSPRGGPRLGLPHARPSTQLGILGDRPLELVLRARIRERGSAPTAAPADRLLDALGHPAIARAGQDAHALCRPRRPPRSGRGPPRRPGGRPRAPGADRRSPSRAAPRRCAARDAASIASRCQPRSLARACSSAASAAATCSAKVPACRRARARTAEDAADEEDEPRPARRGR